MPEILVQALERPLYATLKELEFLQRVFEAIALGDRESDVGDAQADDQLPVRGIGGVG
jgi:hypothetical protein